MYKKMVLEKIENDKLCNFINEIEKRYGTLENYIDIYLNSINKKTNINNFIGETLIPKENFYLYKKELYKIYKVWFRRKDKNLKPLNYKCFFKELESCNFVFKQKYRGSGEFIQDYWLKPEYVDLVEE